MDITLENTPLPEDSSLSSNAQAPPQAANMPKIRCVPATPVDKAGSNAVIFNYLAEGAANAVFKVQPCLQPLERCFVFVDDDNRTISRSNFMGKVLRISKGKPKTIKYADIISGYEEIRPLFRPDLSSGSLDVMSIDPSNGLAKGPQGTIPTTGSSSFEEFLMEDEGVSISREVLDHLIKELDAQCPLHERTALHALEEKAILLPDMSSVPGSALMFEVKPKWLTQSPNAPRDAYRCRTCALHASRKTKAEPTHGVYICPLQLLAGNAGAIEQYLKDRIQHSRDSGDQVSDNDAAIVLKRGVTYLTSGRGHKLLRHLRALQAQLDPKGALERDRIPSADREEYDRHLRLAMTFRDCSLFIRIPYADQDLPIDAKLGDLDFKSADKIDDWMDKEVMLINGGWYTDLKAPDYDCFISGGWKRYVPHYM